jgi:hypothetical protein
MSKYNVTVTRISHATRQFQVEADDSISASEEALAQAGDHVFTEKDAEYQVASVALAADPSKPHDASCARRLHGAAPCTCSKELETEG